MPPGIFEGSPWLGDTVEFTRMPLNNIPRIPTQILLRFERVDAIVTSCRTSPAVLRRAPKSSCPTAQRSAPSPMASFLSILADRDREVGKLGHPRSFEHRIFARSTRAGNEMSSSTVASQYLVGSGSLSGHSISSVSADRPAAPHRCGAHRTRAKREPIQLAVVQGEVGTVARRPLAPRSYGPPKPKARAATPQRSRPVRGTDHLRKFFHVYRKS